MSTKKTTAKAPPEVSTLAAESDQSLSAHREKDVEKIATRIEDQINSLYDAMSIIAVARRSFDTDEGDDNHMYRLLRLAYDKFLEIADELEGVTLSEEKLRLRSQARADGEVSHG